MKARKYVLLIGVMTAFQIPAIAFQPAVGVNYFEIIDPNNCWLDKSSVYIGAPATFAQVGCGEAVPVDMNIGKGCLVFQTTRPAGGPPWAWWILNIRIQGWPTVDFMRYGRS